MPRKGENIYKRKDGRWEGRYIGCYDENHKAKYVYIYGKTYTEVKQKLVVERGRQKQHVPAEKKQITYGEVLDLWLHSTKTSIKESTYARYAHLINYHIKPQLGDYKLSMLSTEIIENFIENQLVEGQLDRTGGLAPKTVIDLLAIAKSTIGYAQYKGFPVICNLSRLSVKRKDKEMRVLTPSERESLIGILMEDMDSFKFGVFLALYTGIRIGELCALQWKDIVFPLPATDLLYVGSRTGKKLSNYCIHTIGDLATSNPNFLKEKLGKIGPMLWGFANGLDTGAVAKYEGREAQTPIKSIGNSWTTPRDLFTDEDVWIVLYLLSESVAARLRENHFRCRGVEVSLRDSSLFSFERQVKLPQPTMQEKDIAEAAYQLYKKNYRWSEHLRSVGVRAIDLRPDTEPNQISFEYSAEKQEETERLESAIDGIRNRFGYYSVQRAVMYKDRFLSHCDAKGDHTIHPHGYLQGSI